MKKIRKKKKVKIRIHVGIKGELPKKKKETFFYFFFFYYFISCFVQTLMLIIYGNSR